MPSRNWPPPIPSPTVRAVDAERTADEPIEERPSRPRTTPGPRSAERRTAELRKGDHRTAPAEEEAEPSSGAIPASDYRAGDARPVPTNIYRARRPAVAILLIIPAVAFGLLLIRALAISASVDPFLIGGVIASACALTSLPLVVAGLYGLVTGAAHGAEHYGFKVGHGRRWRTSSSAWPSHSPPDSPSADAIR